MPDEFRVIAGLLGSLLLFGAGVCLDKLLGGQAFALFVIAVIWLLTAFFGEDL